MGGDHYEGSKENPFYQRQVDNPPCIRSVSAPTFGLSTPEKEGDGSRHHQVAAVRVGRTLEIVSALMHARDGITVSIIARRLDVSRARIYQVYAECRRLKIDVGKWGKRTRAA